MAKNRWISVTGNWNSGSSWSEGSVPADADDVIFDGRASKKSVTSGHTAQGDIQLASMTVMDSYPGNIGSSGDSGRLLIDIETKLIHRGSGTLYANLADPNNDDLRIIIDSPNMVRAFELGGTAVNFMHVHSGHVHISSDHTGNLSYLRLTPAYGRNASVTCEAESSTTWREVQMTGGTFINSRKFATATISYLNLLGGVCIQNEGSINRANIAGTLDWRASGSSVSPLITHANVLPGGLLDFRNSLVNGTITALTIMPGGNFEPTPGLTVTKPYDLRKRVPDF